MSSLTPQWRNNQSSAREGVIVSSTLGAEMKHFAGASYFLETFTTVMLSVRFRRCVLQHYRRAHLFISFAMCLCSCSLPLLQDSILWHVMHWEVVCRSCYMIRLIGMLPLKISLQNSRVPHFTLLLYLDPERVMYLSPGQRFPCSLTLPVYLLLWICCIWKTLLNLSESLSWT